SMALLQTATRSGGVGLPNIRQYYRAAILSSGVLLHAPPNTTQWADMERAQFCNQSLLEHLWTPKQIRPRRQALLPTTQLTIAMWDEFMGAKGYNNSFHPKSPISTLRAVVPDIPLQDWHSLTQLKDK
ncbi:Hypothetical predicted protein, partial [Pelobates cultripes]